MLPFSDLGSALVDVLIPAVMIVAFFIALVCLGAILNNRGLTVPVSSPRRTPGGLPARAPRSSGETTEAPHRVRYIEKRAQPRVHCWCGDISQPLPDVAACHAWMLAHSAINEQLEAAQRDLAWSRTIRQIVNEEQA